jgi:hypothetical protein
MNDCQLLNNACFVQLVNVSYKIYSFEPDSLEPSQGERIPSVRSDISARIP